MVEEVGGVAEGGKEEELMVTIIHAGGSRKTYPAYVTDSFVFLVVPMTEHKAFRLSDGRSRNSRLAMWTVDRRDLRLCREVSAAQRRPARAPGTRYKRRAKYVTQ